MSGLKLTPAQIHTRDDFHLLIPYVIATSPTGPKLTMIYIQNDLSDSPLDTNEMKWILSSVTVLSSCCAWSTLIQYTTLLAFPICGTTPKQN